MPEPTTTEERAPLEGAGMAKDAADLATKVASGDWTEGLVSYAKHAAKEAVKEIPEQIPEKILVETGKGTAGTAGTMADDPEPPDDQNQLYDGPGPHRVSGTL